MLFYVFNIFQHFRGNSFSHSYISFSHRRGGLASGYVAQLWSLPSIRYKQVIRLTVVLHHDTYIPRVESSEWVGPDYWVLLML